MPYNAKLADQINDILRATAGIERRHMLGGLCYLLNGNMCFGIIGDRLMLRIDPKTYKEALQLAHASPLDITGRPMKDMIYVLPDGLTSKDAIEKWITIGIDFVKTLPPK